jgi:hypothetical protein
MKVLRFMVLIYSMNQRTYSKFIIGFLIGFLPATTFAWAFRTPKPAKIVEINEASLAQLNNFIEELWNMTNGRYSPTSGATASTGTGTIKMGSANNANSAGFIKFEKTDGTIVYVPYFSDDTP